MDKRTETLNKAKEVLKSHISKAGKSYKENQDKKAEPTAMDKAKIWTENKKKEITGPKKLKRFGRWIKNGSYNLAHDSLGVAKTGVHEGRANIIASKIIANRIGGKKTTKSEKKFLGKQAVNNVKTGVTVGTVVAANVAMGTTPAPGMSEALAWTTNKIGMTPKKQAIPRRYKDQHKWSKTNGWIDKKSSAVHEAKKKYNREFLSKNPDLKKKKDTEHSYDPELNMEVRAENLRNISNKRIGDTDKALSLAAKVGGGLAGGSLGNLVGKAFHKRKRSRLYHLQSKGGLRTDKENQEMDKIKKFLSTSKTAFVAGGAALGAVGGGAAYYKFRKNSDKKDRKNVFNSDVKV